MKKKLLLVVFTFAFVLLLFACSNDKIDAGKKVSSITINVDGEDIKINSKDDPVETLEKLSCVYFGLSIDPQERTLSYSAKEDAKNVTTHDSDELQSYNNSYEANDVMVDYYGFSKSVEQVLYSYNHTGKRVENGKTNDYYEDVSVYAQYEDIDSSSEYFNSKYGGLKQQICSVKYLDKNLDESKYGEGTINCLDMHSYQDYYDQEDYLAVSYLDSYYNKFSYNYDNIYYISPTSNKYIYQVLSSDYYKIKITLTDKYIIIENTFNLSRRDLYELGEIAIDPSTELKDNKDKVYYVGYYDYKNMDGNSMKADYYEFYEIDIDSNSGLYDEDSYYVKYNPDFLEKYLGTEYSRTYETETKYIATVKEYSEKDINKFKDSIKE